MDRSRSKRISLKQSAAVGNYSVSSPLTATKGVISQPELLSHGFKTPLTFRNGILERYLKETFCLSFPFLCCPVLLRHSASLFFFSTWKSVYICLCVCELVKRGLGWCKIFLPCHRLLPHCYNFIDSGSVCVLWSYTGVKDNWSRGCLFHGNGGKWNPVPVLFSVPYKRDEIQ